jgi:hypothetical protein
MAYGNWGAFVYRNGERHKDGEDACPIPKKEGELFFETFHAVLGDGDVILCGYKHYPSLYAKDADGCHVQVDIGDADEFGFLSGEYEGHKYWTYEYDGNMLNLTLTEPDGTKWTATCGYCYGAGHMDGDDDE